VFATPRTTSFAFEVATYGNGILELVHNQQLRESFFHVTAFFIFRAAF
jgi:hypothetical protein